MDHEEALKLPLYRSHKNVRAFKISFLRPSSKLHGWELVSAGDPRHSVHVDNGFCAKHNPQAGGYYVLYEDGYQSYSPAKAFEEGYTRALEPHQQRVLEEQKELDAKADKLAKFMEGNIFAGLPPEEKDRMHRQFHAMCAYSLALGQRIAAF